MIARGLLGDLEPVGDRDRAQALGEKLQHLVLARRKTRACGRRRFLSPDRDAADADDLPVLEQGRGYDLQRHARAVLRQRRHLVDRPLGACVQLPLELVAHLLEPVVGNEQRRLSAENLGRAVAEQLDDGAADPRDSPLPVGRVGDDLEIVEESEDVLDHLDSIRLLQDEFGGFTAFVPWSFKPGHTMLEKWIKHYQGPNAYLRMLAVSRLYLDNFPHVQASWFSEGKRAGQIALHFGADDWGGTLFEENVHRAADYVNTIGVDEIVTLIREAGFTPAQRNTKYQILRIY